ncbi:MAG: hypothetical protein Barrevirus5_16 [Barrevirus sp.]|uniref:Uncharacterized protein n=1 Tax=Barrevirus sp. TaxID=2487763 RepID=A0A3G4ZQ01_9VIRU|nr:MAG: hypothetical protein Barrevirus5_16 [Barrevirus sp.]
MDKIMDKYNSQILSDNLKNYGYTDTFGGGGGNKDLATTISETLDTDSQNLLLKCLTDCQIKAQLLRYELINLVREPVQELTLVEFEKVAIPLINRYHWKAGGYKLEDSEWLIHRHDSEIHDIRENELLFENTVARADVDDDELKIYLDHLVRQLSSLSQNIEAEYKIKNKRSRTVTVLIWFIDNNVKVSSHKDSESNDSNVGL